MLTMSHNHYDYSEISAKGLNETCSDIEYTYDCIAGGTWYILYYGILVIFISLALIYFIFYQPTHAAK